LYAVMVMRNSPKLDALTSWRFFAAALIVQLHASAFFNLPKIYEHFQISQGVSFFFVLSGFILAYNYGEPRGRSWRDFYVARFARIWPAHIAALALFLVLAAQPLAGLTGDGKHRVGLFFANALMLHSWIPTQEAAFSFNAASWSISTEFTFYLLFPLIILSKRGRLPWLSLLMSLALTLGFIGLSAHRNLPLALPVNRISLIGTLLVNPLARLWEFVLGAFAYFAFKAYKDRRQPANSVALWSGLEACAVGCAVLAMWASIYGRFANAAPDAVRYYIVWAGSAPAFCAVILVFAFGRGYLSRVFSTRPLIFLGEISYSLYLVHIPVLVYFTRFPERFSGKTWAYLVYLGATAAVSCALHFIVESPMRSIIRRTFSRPRVLTAEPLEHVAA
jgi:peptidoglycan/LPS O-acetylase OafA/YrhL